MTTLEELKHGQTVRYRLGQAGISQVDWQPWKDGSLYLVRRPSDLPKRFRSRCRFWQAETILTLAIKGTDPEFSQGDWSETHHCFNCEDYYLEIEGL